MIICVIMIIILLCGCSNGGISKTDVTTPTTITQSDSFKHLAVFYDEEMPSNCKYDSASNDSGRILYNDREIAVRSSGYGYSENLDAGEFMKFWNKDVEIDEIRMVESTKEHMFLYACRGKEKSYYVAFCEAYEDFPMSVTVYEVTDNSNEDKVLQIAQSLSVRQEWK